MGKKLFKTAVLNRVFSTPIKQTHRIRPPGQGGCSSANKHIAYDLQGRAAVRVHTVFTVIFQYKLECSSTSVYLLVHFERHIWTSNFLSHDWSFVVKSHFVSVLPLDAQHQERSSIWSSIHVSPTTCYLFLWQQSFLQHLLEYHRSQNGPQNENAAVVRMYCLLTTALDYFCSNTKCKNVPTSNLCRS